jgi:hypothetical protein
VDKWLDLIILAGKVIWVQIQTVLHPIAEVLESAMQSFWFIFILTIIAGYLVIEALNAIISFYRSHNFIHRKMVVEPSRDIEFSLFLQTLWQSDSSKGMLANSKSAKSRYLQFSGQERSFIQNYLEHRLQFLRANHLLFLLAALFVGLLSSIFAGVLPVNHVAITGETVLKTFLFLITWLMIMQMKYVSIKKQTFLHLSWIQETNRTVPVNTIQEDAAVTIENESNPSY